MRTRWAALLCVAVVLTASGCGTAPESAPPVASTPAPSVPRPTAAIEVPVTRATPAPVRESVPPTRVMIEAIGADVPVVPVGVEAGGFMELPVDPAIAGWYRFGADPSSPDGNVVISAHIDAPEYPIGPFSRLRDLAAGSTIEVTDAAGQTHAYAVASVTYYPKSELPVSELFARSGTDALVLITCGGAFDARTGRYADNVVAIATPIA